MTSNDPESDPRAAEIEARIRRKHWREAAEMAASWLAESRDTGDEVGGVRALSFQGVLALARRDLEVADELFEQALERATVPGLPTLVAEVAERWALALLEEQEHRKARDVAERRLEHARESGDPRLECRALVGLATILRAQKRPREAQSALEAGLRLAEEHDLVECRARTHFGIGEVHADRGDHARADEHFDAAERVLRETGTDRRLFDVLQRRGPTLTQLGKHDAAVACHDEALARAKALDDVLLGIEALAGKVNALETARRYAEASEASEQRLELCRKADDAFLGCHALEQLARIERKAKRSKEAARAIERGLKAANAARKRNLEARIRREFAELKSQDGDRSGAAKELLVCAQLSLDGGKSWEAIHDFERMAQILNVDEREKRQLELVEDAATDCGFDPTPKDLLARARVLMHFGLHDTALDMLDRARTGDPALLDAWMRCSLCHVEGMIYRHSGDIERAVECFRERVEMERKRNAPRDLAFGLNSLGAALVDLGEHADAIAAFEEGLEIFEALEDRSGAAIMQNGIALAHSAAGRHEHALARLDASLAIHEELGDRADRAVTLNIRGEVLWKLGRTREALADLEESKALFVAMEDLRGLCFALPRLGRARISEGQAEAGLKDLRAAIDAAMSSPDHRQLVRAYQAMGEGLVELKRAGDAIAPLERALVGAERMRDRVLTEGVRASLAAARSAAARRS